MGNVKMRLVHVIVFTSTCLLLSAQQSGTYKGKLIDFESNTAIPFATIKLKNQWRGVITNAAGDFQLPSYLKNTSDTLVISCIGYDSKMVPIKQLTEDRINVIKLQSTTIHLSEVVIRAKKIRKPSAYKIIKKAIKNISLNYPQHTYSTVAYYRDYQVKDSEYINLNEAIVEVLDKGFQTKNRLSSKIKLYQYRKNKDFEADSIIEGVYDNVENKFIPNARLYSFGGNELSILLMHDAIRNYNVDTYSYVYRLSSDFMINHSFRLVKPVMLDKVALYHIEFDSRQDKIGLNHFAKGTVYIQQDNFAIHKLEYSTYEQDNSKSKLLYDIKVEYSKVDSLMYLNYISFNNVFKVRNPLDFKVVDLVFNRSAYTFRIELNNNLAHVSKIDSTNFDVKIGQSKMRIKEVSINPKTIDLMLEQNNQVDVWEPKEILADKIKLNFKDITDVDGRELGKVTYITVNQFRELFVQKIYTPALEPKDSIFVNKTIPLSKNHPVPIQSGFNYFMNTPLKKLHE